MKIKIKRSVQHLQSINIQDEYGTPKEIFNQGCKLAGFVPFVDVCASKLNHVLPNYLTKKDNALSFFWFYNFFMNPPYSEVEIWLQHALQSCRDYKVNGLCLVYAKTDTRWWHNYVEGYAEVHFIKGRIRFLDELGNPTVNKNQNSKSFGKPQCAPYPSCWVIYRA